MRDPLNASQPWLRILVVGICLLSQWPISSKRPDPFRPLITNELHTSLSKLLLPLAAAPTLSSACLFNVNGNSLSTHEEYEDDSLEEGKMRYMIAFITSPALDTSNTSEKSDLRGVLTFSNLSRLLINLTNPHGKNYRPRKFNLNYLNKILHLHDIIGHGRRTCECIHCLNRVRRSDYRLYASLFPFPSFLTSLSFAWSSK